MPKRVNALMLFGDICRPTDPTYLYSTKMSMLCSMVTGYFANHHFSRIRRIAVLRDTRGNWHGFMAAQLLSSVLLIQRRMKIRPVERSDAEGIIALINSVYQEYGDRVHLEGAEADLADVVSHYSAEGCAFVVLEDDGEVVGTHAVVPLEGRSGLCTFRRLYLRPDLRGTGWGEKLMRWAIDAAEQMGFRRVEFWSDVRFTRAHQFFKRLGFQHDGRVRDMNDGWEPYREYFFSMDLVTDKP